MTGELNGFERSRDSTRQWPAVPVVPAGSAALDDLPHDGWTESDAEFLGDGPARAGWRVKYARRVVALDLVILGALLGIAVAFGFGNRETNHWLAAYVASGTMVCFVACMIAVRGWEARALGQGPEEFTRLVRAATATGVLVALVGLALQLTATRPYVFGFIPLGVAAIVVARYFERQALYRRRANGRCMLSVLAVGNEQAVTELVTRTTRVRSQGWTVTGACTPGGTGSDGGDLVAGVPVVGDLDAPAGEVLRGGYQVVAVAPADGWSPLRLRQLAWDLEGRGVELVVHPGLMEVGGPRLHVSPVDGLPLLWLTEPRFTGAARVVKGVMDKVGAALLLLALAPLLVMVYAAVRLDGGPGLYRQTRIGLGGRPFGMLKFRSMVVDADQQRELLVDADEGTGPLFKLRDDPRVTLIGGWLRRYSLDELPQLVNVLAGSMSLVGPRPPLPCEVEGYVEAARRRLLVKPGLTGLWQISGRSDLSWEESIRLDLRYVENWTLALDGLILWKTFRAVVSSDGAY